MKPKTLVVGCCAAVVIVLLTPRVVSQEPLELEVDGPNAGSLAGLSGEWLVREEGPDAPRLSLRCATASGRFTALLTGVAAAPRFEATGRGGPGGVLLLAGPSGPASDRRLGLALRPSGEALLVELLELEPEQRHLTTLHFERAE